MNTAPLVLDPIEIPPEATVYQLIVFPTEIADKFVDEPAQTTEGVAVTTEGALGMPTGIVIAPLLRLSQPLMLVAEA